MAKTHQCALDRNLNIFKQDPDLCETIAIVSPHMSDIEPRIREPLPNEKIVRKKYPQRLCEPAILYLNNFFIAKWLCDLRFKIWHVGSFHRELDLILEYFELSFQNYANCKLLWKYVKLLLQLLGKAFKDCGLQNFLKWSTIFKILR